MSKSKITPISSLVREMEDAGNPLVLMAYDFFTEPKTSRYGRYWGNFIATLVAVHILLIGLESCDGPNQYVGRENRSKFDFLLTKFQYDMIDFVCFVPLLIDSASRLLLLIVILLFSENAPIRSKLLGDKFNFLLYIFDVVSVAPYLVNNYFLIPHKVDLKEGRLLLVVVDLMLTGRILRITKDIPAIWAIRIALSRSFEHLILPLFFFMVFNITGAVIFYFLEPCYMKNSCPWHDLFEAIFYSVVTMSTSECVVSIIFALCVLFLNELFFSSAILLYHYYYILITVYYQLVTVLKCLHMKLDDSSLAAS